MNLLSVSRGMNIHLSWLLTDASETNLHSAQYKPPLGSRLKAGRQC